MDSKAHRVATNPAPDPTDIRSAYMHEMSHEILDPATERALCRLVARGKRDGATGRDQARGRAARRTLVRHNLRLVVMWATRYKSPVPMLDLVQEGTLGLMRAVDKFRLDHPKRPRLSTYAVPWIRQHIARAIDQQGRIIRAPVHVEQRARDVKRARAQLLQELGREPNVDEVSAVVDLTPEQIEQVERATVHALSLDAPAIAGEADGSTLGDFIPTDDTAHDRAWSAILEQTVADALERLDARTANIIRMRYGMGKYAAHPPYTLEQIGKRYGLTRERVRQIEMEGLMMLRACSTIRAAASPRDPSPDPSSGGAVARMATPPKRKRRRQGIPICGDRLRAAREAAGIPSSAELARRAGLNYNVVRRAELGARSECTGALIYLRHRTRERLAAALNMTLEDFDREMGA